MWGFKSPLAHALAGPWRRGRERLAGVARRGRASGGGVQLRAQPGSGHRRVVEAGKRLLVGVGGTKDEVFSAGKADDLQAEGQTVEEAAR
jgi:hypothetical protein